MDAETLHSIVDDLYDACLAPERWPAVMARLGTAFHAATGAVIFVSVPEHGGIRVMGPPDRDASIEDYIARWSASAPAAAEGCRARKESRDDRAVDIVRAARTLPQGAICTDDMVMSRDLLTRTAFYNEHLVKFDFHHALAAKIWDGLRDGGLLSLSRAERQGRFSSEEVDRLGRLLPHVRRALAMSERFAWSRIGGGSGPAALDGAECATFLLDRSGRCVHVNAAGETLARAADGLGLAGERLRVADPAAGDLLAKAVGKATRGDAHGRRSGDALQVPRLSGRASWAVLVTPLAADRDWFLPHPPRAVVTVVDPERRGMPSSEQLKALFRLTASEAAVASGIGRGLALKEVASDLGLTVDSARQYLSRIYAKTDTRRQNDLTRLLWQVGAARIRSHL